MKAAQRRLIAVAWITYAACYLARANIAPAMPAMQGALGLSKSQVGLINSGLFWSYAVGQLINGQLGDRISPRAFVFWGMLASALLSFAVGSSALYVSVLLLWTINGYFQATGWGPILRTLANWFPPTAVRRISGLFGSCFVAGQALSTLLAGWLVERYGWRMAFWGPALLMILLALLWYSAVRDHPPENEPTRPPPPAPRPTLFAPFLATIASGLRRHWPLVSASAFLGFCHVSITVWMPTYFHEVAGLSIGLASTLAALLPFAGIAGTLLIGWLVSRHLVQREAHGLAACLVILALLCTIYPLLPIRLGLITGALMLIASVLFGASSLMLTTMPLVLSERAGASSMAGLMTFAYNIGAGASGAVIGALLDRQSWPLVFVALAIGAALSAIFVVIGVRFHGKVKG